MAENGKGKITTPMFRLSFPSLWEPKKKMNSEEEQYRMVMLFPKAMIAQLKPMRDLALAAVIAKFGAERKNWPANLRNIDWNTYLSTKGKDGWPFRDGDMQDYDGYAGMISVAAASSSRPAVFDRQLQPVMDKEEVYAGCYCQASLSAYAWHHQQSNSKGVSFGLLGIRKVEDGEPFTRRAEASDFQAYEEMSDAADAYADAAGGDW